MLSKQALDDFRAIWKKEFGQNISDQKALEEGTALITLMRAVYRPIKKEWLEEYEAKRAEQKS
jgi:hypothetical protein